MHLEPGVLDLATTWIDRYRREAEERYRRLDAVLAQMNEAETNEAETNEPGPIDPGTPRTGGDPS